MENLSSARKRLPSLSSARTRVLCPKCDVEMNPTTLVGIDLEKCPACEGLFFDKGEAEKLVRRKLRFYRMRRFFGVGFA